MHAAGIESLLCCCCKSFSINTLNCSECGTAAHVVLYVTSKLCVCVLFLCVLLQCRVALTHLIQSLPPCHVMAFQHCDIIQDAHAHPCMFLCVSVRSTPMLTAELRGQHHPQKCVDMPPLNKEAFFYSA